MLQLEQSKPGRRRLLVDEEFAPRTPTRIRQALGNPVLANKMFERRPEVGLYAPLRACICEDQAGVCHFTYDQPSALLGQFDGDEISAVARMLDRKMGDLAVFLTE